MKLQLGYEHFDEAGKRTTRLTPVDVPITVPEPWGALLKSVFAAADASDAQPGDGEVDVPIPATAFEAAKDKLPTIIAAAIPDGGNVFLRLS